MAEKTYRVTMNERQLRLINTALEEWFRLRLGQAWDLMDDLCSRGRDLSRDNPKFEKVFDGYLEQRDALRPVMEALLRAAIGDSTFKTDDENLAVEMWQTIRHQFWKERENHETWTVDSSPALKTTNEPMIRIELINDGGDKG